MAIQYGLEAKLMHGSAPGPQTNTSTKLVPDLLSLLYLSLSLSLTLWKE